MNETSGELQHLVPQEQDELPVTPPPITIAHGKTGNPLSPTSPSTKVSSGSGSVQGKSGNHSSTRNKTNFTIGTNLTTPSYSGAGGHPTRLLYVNEKLSRGPSLLSEHSARYTPKPSTSNTASASARFHKKEMPVQHHVFLSDITDVRNMEKDLLRLLEDFHSGKLRAFGKDCSMEQMNSIREQQERLARLHFDLCAQQELFTPLSEDGLKASKEHMGKLMTSLEQLSVSIERLHSDGGGGGGHLGSGSSGGNNENEQTPPVATTTTITTPTTTTNNNTNNSSNTLQPTPPPQTTPQLLKK